MYAPKSHAARSAVPARGGDRAGDSSERAPPQAVSCLLQLLALTFYLAGRREQRGPRLAGAPSPSASRLSSLLVYAAGHTSASWLLYPACRKNKWGSRIYITALVRSSSCATQFIYLKCTVTCLLVYSGSCCHHGRFCGVSITPSSPRTISSHSPLFPLARKNSTKEASGETVLTGDILRNNYLT